MIEAVYFFLDNIFVLATKFINRLWVSLLALIASINRRLVIELLCITVYDQTK